MHVPCPAKSHYANSSTGNWPSSSGRPLCEKRPSTGPRIKHGGIPSGDNMTNPIRSNILWPAETTGCWSDEFTASAVLSLLRKEPTSLPLNNATKSNSRSRQSLLCTVCFETLDDDFYPERPIAAGCDHTTIPGIHICIGCLRRGLGMQISSGTTMLTCPLCHEQLSDEEVQLWASPPTFRTYERMRTWQTLEEDAEFVTCIRQNCGYGQLHAGGLEDPIVVCGSCGTRTCFIHRQTPWHEGLTCAEYEGIIHPTVFEVRDDGLGEIDDEISPRIHGLRCGWMDSSNEELLSRRTIDVIARPCPGCKVPTERAGGCKHIRCGVCRQEWCWDCGICWKRGHLDVECWPLCGPQWE